MTRIGNHNVIRGQILSSLRLVMRDLHAAIRRSDTRANDSPSNPDTKRCIVTCSKFLFASALVAFGIGTVAAQDQPKPPATYPALPSEIPAKFEPTNDGFDHVRRDVMIPMRDGVKLHTVILVPKGAKNAPILLTRTPYDAN